MQFSFHNIFFDIDLTFFLFFAMSRQKEKKMFLSSSRSYLLLELFSCCFLGCTLQHLVVVLVIVARAVVVIVARRLSTIYHLSWCIFFCRHFFFSLSLSHFTPKTNRLTLCNIPQFLHTLCNAHLLGSHFSFFFRFFSFFFWKSDVVADLSNICEKMRISTFRT